jgi:hypothetical protein
MAPMARTQSAPSRVDLQHGQQYRTPVKENPHQHHPPQADSSDHQLAGGSRATNQSSPSPVLGNRNPMTPTPGQAYMGSGATSPPLNTGAPPGISVEGIAAPAAGAGAKGPCVGFQRLLSSASATGSKVGKDEQQNPNPPQGQGQARAPGPSSHAPANSAHGFSSINMTTSQYLSAHLAGSAPPPDPGNLLTMHTTIPSPWRCTKIPKLPPN